jgi:hypothetical protein
VKIRDFFGNPLLDGLFPISAYYQWSFAAFRRCVVRLRGFGNVRRLLRAGAPALLAAFIIGCGSDEPTLKNEMSSSDKAAYEQKNKRTDDKPDTSPTAQAQKGADYKNATGGSGPDRRGKGR